MPLKERTPRASVAPANWPCAMVTRVDAVSGRKLELPSLGINKAAIRTIPAIDFDIASSLGERIGLHRISGNMIGRVHGKNMHRGSRAGP